MGVFSLTGWSRLLLTGFLVSRHTQDTAFRIPNCLYETFTLCGRPFQAVPVLRILHPAVLLPRHCRNNRGLGSFLFARRYYGNRCFFLLLLLLRCFSSEGLLTFRCDRPSACRVAPFGYPRIKSRLLIPEAFRSLPRPSSPPRATGIPRTPFLTFSSCQYPPFARISTSFLIP